MLTIGVMARRLNRPPHAIDYVLRTRQIRPAAIAGNSRVFTEEDLDRVAAELRHIEAQKGPPPELEGDRD